MLSTFEIDLNPDGAVVDHGHAANVLDAPLFTRRCAAAVTVGVDASVKPALA